MKSFIFIILGSISLALGILGIALPLLPTTPFVLLAAALFMRSSPRLHAWLTRSRVFGEYLRNYKENKRLPLRARIGSITLLWISISYSVFWVVDQIFWLQILLVIIAILVSLHIINLGKKR